MKINFDKILVYGLLLFAVIALIYTLTSFFEISFPKNIKKSAIKSNFETISTGSTNAGDASIDLTPKGIQNGKFMVDFSANTHSVDLSQFDLMLLTKLKYGGNLIGPESAPKLSGHHISGTLVFDTGKEIKNFKITIKGIPAIEERAFEWS